MKPPSRGNGVSYKSITHVICVNDMWQTNATHALYVCVCVIAILRQADDGVWITTFVLNRSIGGITCVLPTL